MTQLRDDYSAFQACQTEVLVIVPNGPHMLKARLPELALHQTRPLTRRQDRHDLPAEKNLP